MCPLSACLLPARPRLTHRVSEGSALGQSRSDLRQGWGQRGPSPSWCYQPSTFPTSLASASAKKTVGYLSLLIPQTSCPNGVISLLDSFPGPQMVGLSLWGPTLTHLLLIPHRSYAQPWSLPQVFFRSWGSLSMSCLFFSYVTHSTATD